MTENQLLAAMAAEPDKYGFSRERGGLTNYGATRMGGHLAELPANAWDDTDYRGRVWEERYVRTHAIEPFIVRTFAAEFAEKGIRHYIERETLGATNYGREGD